MRTAIDTHWIQKTSHGDEERTAKMSLWPKVKAVDKAHGKLKHLTASSHQGKVRGYVSKFLEKYVRF